MSRLLVKLAVVVALCGAVAVAQEAMPDSNATAASKPCVIVKHKGIVGRRLMWTALVGVPMAPGAKYNLVDNMAYTPVKMSFKGKELQTMQQQGIHVIVLEKNYKGADLEAAKNSCRESSTPAPDGKEESSVPTEKGKSSE